jgi:hypothetical protein
MADPGELIDPSLLSQLQAYFAPGGTGRDMILAAPWGAINGVRRIASLPEDTEALFQSAGRAALSRAAPALADALPYDWSNVRFQLRQVPQAIDAAMALSAPSQPAGSTTPAGERSTWATTGRMAERAFGPEYQPQTPQGEQTKQIAELLTSLPIMRFVTGPLGLLSSVPR